MEGDKIDIAVEKKKKYICFKITGEYTEQEDFNRIKEIGIITKRNGYSAILVDVRNLNYKFDTSKRFTLSEYWAKICMDVGIISTAILGSKGIIDPFTETVVANRGGNLRLFIDKKDAIHWLQQYNH